MSFLPYQSAHAHMHTQSEVLDGGCLQVARSLSDRGYMCHWPQACLFIALEGREGVGKGRRLSRPVIVDQWPIWWAVKSNGVFWISWNVRVNDVVKSLNYCSKMLSWTFLYDKKMLAFFFSILFFIYFFKFKKIFFLELSSFYNYSHHFFLTHTTYIYLIAWSTFNVKL